MTILIMFDLVEILRSSQYFIKKKKKIVGHIDTIMIVLNTLFSNHSIENVQLTFVTNTFFRMGHLMQ